MDVENLTSGSLLMLHDAVLKALEIDDNLPQEDSKIYEVRASRDWKKWSDRLASEMDRRGVVYNNVPW